MQLPLSSNNCFLFVVDICLSDKELNALKEELINVIRNLPIDGTTFVGLISFNQNVDVSELSSKINT